MDNTAGLYTIIGILLTLVTLLSSVVFRIGHLFARVEIIEKWKVTMRDDMHEISTILTGLRAEITGLTKIIDERTERRSSTSARLELKQHD